MPGRLEECITVLKLSILSYSEDLLQRIEMEMSDIINSLSLTYLWLHIPQKAKMGTCTIGVIHILRAHTLCIKL